MADKVGSFSDRSIIAFRDRMSWFKSLTLNNSYSSKRISSDWNLGKLKRLIKLDFWILPLKTTLFWVKLAINNISKKRTALSTVFFDIFKKVFKIFSSPK